MAKRIEALLVTKGHIFKREPFFQMLDALEIPDQETRINWTHVEHPAAGAVLHPVRAAEFDSIVFYDMPGVVFTQSDPPFAHYDPSEEYKQNFLALLESGKGMVFLHHAIASWPTWPEFAEIVGGRFHFLPGELGGKHYPGSGFRFRSEQTITVLDEKHPVTEGVEPSFDIVDEAYLFPVLEDAVTPLLRSDYEFTAESFPMGGVGFEQHPPGTNLIGWTKRAYNSPIVYLQGGHGPEAYANRNYQRLLANAVRWTASSGVGPARETTQSSVGGRLQLWQDGRQVAR